MFYFTIKRHFVEFVLLLLLLFVLGACQNWNPWNIRPEFDRNRWPGNRELPLCPPDARFPSRCYAPPFYPYDPIERNIQGKGFVVGRSMRYQRDRYVNWFLGIPYARAPVDRLRFKLPEDLGQGWDRNIDRWDASYYRPACPQDIWSRQDQYYEPRNISEDCLYLNIFAPNLTGRDHYGQKRPVFFFVDGEDYRAGDAMQTPGHILARREVVVVTLNYRLGALGFMSTENAESPGNYGLHDLIKALLFVQTHIAQFWGDPDQITLVGSGSGASMVSLLIVSPHSRHGYRKLFHQAILMSGTDMCEWSFTGHLYLSSPLEYTRELGRQVGCDPDYTLSVKSLVECLRYKHYEEMVNGTINTYRKYGQLAYPFSPVIDGPQGILPKKPEELRKEKSFLDIKILAGFPKDGGAYLAKNITRNVLGVNIDKSLDQAGFREILRKMIYQRELIRDKHEVINALEFEYTYWSRPENKTAVRQNLINLYTDMMWGWCIDSTLKYHAEMKQPVYMYLFNHRSDYEPLRFWMGVPYRKDVDYLFGAPFYNNTLGNITNVVYDQVDWTYLDRNISAFVQDMWVNFTKYGEPTTEWTRNVTWYPFTLTNLSYLFISEWSYMDINYRQNYFAFWREYFPTVSGYKAIWELTTPKPTALPLYDFQAATWSLSGLSLIAFLIVGALAISYWRRQRRP